MSVGGGTFARIHISTNVSMMLRNWSSTRPGTSILALYSVTIPTHNSKNTTSASGLSNPANMRFVRSSHTRLSNCNACMAVLLYSSMPPDGITVWTALLPVLRGIAGGGGAFGALGSFGSFCADGILWPLTATIASGSLGGAGGMGFSIASSACSVLGGGGGAAAGGGGVRVSKPLGPDADEPAADADVGAPAAAPAGTDVDDA